MRKVLVLLTTLALLAGCGGDDDSESSESKTDSTTAPATTRPTAEQDKQRAGRIVLTAADLPGYTEDTSSDDDDDDEVDRAFAACVQNDPVLTAQEPADPRTVEGKDFEKSAEQQLVSSKASIAETAEQAQAALAQLRNQTVLNCLERAFRPELQKSLDAGDTLNSLNVTTLPVASVGDESVGFRIAATVTTSGQRVPITFDFTIIRRERAVAFLLTTAVARSFSNSERDALASKMADRMAA